MNLVQVRVWGSGRIGFTWARVCDWARRIKEDKLNEMQITGCEITVLKPRISSPNPLAKQANNTKGYH